jgi:hypothetical protein
MKPRESKIGIGRYASLSKSAILFMAVFLTSSLFPAWASRETAGQSVGKGLQIQSASLSSPETGAEVISTSTYVPQTIYCASDDERLHYCDADTRGGVRLVRQRSGSACIQGRTWGYDRRGIWVDRGCRADFELRNDRSDRDRDRDRDRYRDRDRGRGDYSQVFYCESGDEKRHYCQEGNRGRVRLVRQRSGSPCIEGRTWGRDRNGFFVDRGCRADFEVRR